MAGIELRIGAHVHSRSDDHVFVDDGAAHHGSLAYADVVHDHRVFDERPLVDLDARGDDRTPHGAAGDDRAGRHDGVERLADSTVVLEDELGRRQLGRAREDGPVGVVQVERRLHGDQVHAGVVVAVERADVTPITPFDPCAPADVVGIEIVKMGLAALHETRDDIAAHVMAAVRVLRVLPQGVHQSGGVEDVVTHRSVKVLPACR